MDTPSMIDVTCPCCQARLTVDPERQMVIHHESATKTPPTIDLHDALGALKSEASRREAQFQQALAAERLKGKVLERKFEESFKKTKDQPVTKPLRDFDLE